MSSSADSGVWVRVQVVWSVQWALQYDSESSIGFEWFILRIWTHVAHIYTQKCSLGNTCRRSLRLTHHLLRVYLSVYISMRIVVGRVIFTYQRCPLYQRCMHTCTMTHIHKCTGTHTHTRTHVCRYLSMHIMISNCIHMCVHLSLSLSLFLSLHIFTYTGEGDGSLSESNAFSRTTSASDNWSFNGGDDGTNEVGSSGSDIDDTTHDSLGKCRDSQYSKETWNKDFKTLVFKLTL